MLCVPNSADPGVDRTSRFDPMQRFTRAEGLAAGITRWQLRGRDFVRLHRNVYVSPRAPRTLPLRARAALRVAPADSIVSHQTAALLWGSSVPPSADVHVRIPHGETMKVDGVRTHIGLRVPVTRWRGHGKPPAHAHPPGRSPGALRQLHHPRPGHRRMAPALRAGLTRSCGSRSSTRDASTVTTTRSGRRTSTGARTWTDGRGEWFKASPPACSTTRSHTQRIDQARVDRGAAPTRSFTEEWRRYFPGRDVA
jgi:hypothetical protein